MRGAGMMMAALALALLALGACRKPPPVQSAAPGGEELAQRLRAETVLGLALVGGTEAQRLAPAVPDGTVEPDPVARARAQAEEHTRRALGVQQLLEDWARAQQAPEEKNRPEDVRQAQRLLSALGYYTGPVNGLNGPLSSAAIRKFQAIQGLPETGEVTGALLATLRAAL